ncbi:MAG: universal stress protein [Chlorobiaceae bacterium]|nr:universal stress protein [Chlorobiaceae bacterium]
MPRFQKLLIAVDSSECSLHAAQVGLDLARELDAETAMIYVVDTSKTIGNPDTGVTREDALIVLKKEAEAVFEQIAQMAGNMKLSRFMPEGHPSDELLKLADFWNADLLVMGTHGYKGWLHFLKGSTAEHTIRFATLPVMVVPARNPHP